MRPTATPAVLAAVCAALLTGCDEPPLAPDIRLGVSGALPVAPIASVEAGAQGLLVTGPWSGAAPVRTFEGATATPVTSFFAYTDGFTGGVRVATGDVTGDGVADIVTGAGPGGNTHVKVFDGVSGSTVRSFFAYAGFTGGVYVAAGDVSGDGVADVVTGAGEGAPPHVKVFDGATGAELRSFFAYGGGFTGGVRVATGDVTGDGRADIITGAGPGGAAHVKVFDGATGAEVRSFLAYGSGFTGGVYVAAGDVNGDGIADIVTGAGAGGPPHVKVFDGATGSEIGSFLAYPAEFTGGVSVAVGDVDGDGLADIVTGAGPGSVGGHVRVFSGRNLALLASFFAYDPSFTGGVMVAAANPEGPRAPTDDALLTAAREAIADGTLVGEGPVGAAADARLAAWLKMLEGARDLIEAGDTREACDLLRQAYLRADGAFPPPDFVSGPAREPLAEMIQALREALECGG
jgi:hypothetical protein